ncbi:Subtilase family protein [Rhizobiales bacterium GAS188]|nr:Subtilase family protein [Rhizobiales bacterium GAS188]
MRDSALDEALTAIGYAKVIVALHPGDGGAPIGAAVAAMASTAAIPRRPSAGARRGVAVTASAASSLELDLQQHFIVPNEAQPLSLAAAVLRTDVTASRRSKAASKQPKSASPRLMRMYPHLRLAIGYVNNGGATALEADSRVASVVKAPELSLIRPVAARPAAPGKVTSWGILRLGADKLWAAGFEGEGVVVGHLDTGVDGSHPALAGAIAAFAEFDMTGELVPGAQPRDSAQHGTHTAGTIVGRSGPKGSFGVAPKAKLASGMVIEGGQTIDRILSGMDWMVEQGCHILSMSLGLRGYTPAFQTVIDSLRAAGVLPVIAVGNEGPLTSRSPGNYANVVSIGAARIKSQAFRAARPSIVPTNRSFPRSLRQASGWCRASPTGDLPKWTAPRWQPPISPVWRRCS